MTDAKRSEYRRMLEQLLAELMQSGPARIEPNRKDPSTVGVVDEDEQALSEMLQTLSSQRNKQRSDTAALIRRALHRLEQTPDDFGLCEECEEEIPPGRLERLPYATLCTECQAKQDPRRGETRKSVRDFK